jgi:hypothetical protein
MPDKEITIADVYHRLGTLEAKVDSAVALEPRVRSLEQSRSRLYGASAVISAIAGFLTTYFTR